MIQSASDWYHDLRIVSYTVTSAGGQKTCQFSAQLINNGAQGQGQDIETCVILTAKDRVPPLKTPTNDSGQRQVNSS